ncbi:MAG: cytochrome-c peroxidase [Lewinellaceae bacterium]|nr:cytochrome-c peroxidase [Lewinellaceae bacterium]MCB9354487.1 cytochrome-c peroxidase [Lewinellaceae bacterium]
MNRPYLLIVFAALAAFLFSFVPSGLSPAERLGERLFFDPVLSLDSTVSCASCHIPAFGFADTLPFSHGVDGRTGKRNTQGITNMSARAAFFFDGRAGTLEQQVLMPIFDTLEMRATPELVTSRLIRHPEYRSAFLQAYGKNPDLESLAASLAAFVRTLETSDTPFDRWMQDRPGGMSAAAVRGREVFMVKGKCFDCHFSPDFTGDEFRNIGLFNGKDLQDMGRFGVSRDSSDLGKFKVPGLRNVALTAPYMHNGMFKTLEEVIDYYDNPDAFVPDAIGRDPLLAKPLNLTVQEKSDLKAFMEALTDDRFVQ